MSTLQDSRTKNYERWRRLQSGALLEMARQNPNDPADWARAYRRFDGRPMRLTPALEDLYRDSHPRIAVQKAAQVGISEYLINQALWAAATRQGGRGNVVYFMPTQVAMDDFVQGRVDRAIMDSPELQALVGPVRGRYKYPDRLRVKRVGPGYVYFRGAESPRQIMAIDADLVILDEMDSMGEWVLSAALKRLGSSRLAWLRVVSTPTIPEAGINGLFLQSDQRSYFIPCLKCGVKQRLTWEENIDIERELVVCRKCRAPIYLWAEGGEWVPAKPGNAAGHGYHISKLYSPMADIAAMVEASRATGMAEVQEFYRSDLGLDYVPRGGSLTIDDLDSCRQDYEMPRGSEKETCMGVDVGAQLHVVIRERLRKDTVGRALFVGTVTAESPAALDDLMARYNVAACVMDGLPEQWLAREFQSRHPAQVFLGYYDQRQGDHSYDYVKGTAHINRTLALDETFERFRRRELGLPREARRLAGRVKGGLGEYYRQLLALKRTLDQDGQGNWQSRYVDGGKPDHFAHAEVYCMLAKPRRSRVEAVILGSDDNDTRGRKAIDKMIDEMQNTNRSRFPGRRF